ncbi:MAG: ABC transporter substrate-binding protein [Verrucomicrobiota bacterium]
MRPATIPPRRGHDGMTRAALLRSGGLAAATLASGGWVPSAIAGPLRHRGRQLGGSLSIVQWTHVIGGFDAWFNGWAKDWGTRNDVEVKVDHISITRLPALVASEAKAQKGHDIVGFLTPPTAYDDQVIDHGSIVRAVERQVGPYSTLGRLSTYNPRRETYLGISDSYVPAPVLWRYDLWNAVGESPATWDHVRAAAPALKEAGYPLGIGLSTEPDSNLVLLDLMAAFGSFLQHWDNTLAIDSPATVEAVKFMADLQRRGQTGDVYGWTQASNNQFLFSGRGSLIVNAISAVRMAEDLQLPVSDDLWIWPMPAGPHGRFALPQATSVYSIWKFAQNREAAETFLADLCVAAEPATLASKLYSFPSFPGAFPPERLRRAAAADTHRPRGKYSILATTAARDTRNVGYPGTTNPAVNETLDRFLIPKMFAQVAQGKLSAANSVRSTASEMKQIWAKWKTAGKV